MRPCSILLSLALLCAAHLLSAQNLRGTAKLIARSGETAILLVQCYGHNERAVLDNAKKLPLHKLLYEGVEGEPAAGDRNSLKILHQTIRKITDDVERFSFNTAVSTFMICCNNLTGCTSLDVLRPLAVLLAPFAPHIAEELWHRMGCEGSVCDAEWPAYDLHYLVEDTVKYPVQFNGKMRFMLELPADADQAAALAAVKAAPEAVKWLGDKEPKKVIFVPKKIINIVC